MLPATHPWFGNELFLKYHFVWEGDELLFLFLWKLESKFGSGCQHIFDIFRTFTESVKSSPKAFQILTYLMSTSEKRAHTECLAGETQLVYHINISAGATPSTV